MSEKTYKPTISGVDSTTFWMEFGNQARIELKNNALAIGKVAIGLQKFNEQNKQIAYVMAYLDVDKALVLANDILSGRLATIAEKGSDELITVYKQPGGQSAEKAQRSDGKPLYREFSISKGNLWIISCQEGPGKVSSTGGFVPDGKYETKVNVGLSSESLKAMALMIQQECLAYRIAQYTKI